MVTKKTDAARLRVGAARICIDPPPEMFPAYSLVSRCDAIHDPCFCRAIAIDSGPVVALILTYELSDPPCAPELKAKISEATGVAEDYITIAVTHNHTCPSDKSFCPPSPERDNFCAAYMDILLAKGVTACTAAMGARRPALCGYGETSSYINVNRNFETLFHYWSTSANFGGYSDKTLSMVKFTDTDGGLIAAVLNYPVHATMALELMPLRTAPDADGTTKLSGNLPGMVCSFAEEYYGNGAVVMWTSAAAGDQGPILSDMQFQYPDGYTSYVRYPDGVAFLQMEYLAGIHAADAIRGLNSIAASSENPALRSAHCKVYLPTQSREGRGGFRMGEIGVRTDFSKPPVYPKIPRRFDDPEHPIEMAVSLLLLGDIAIICAGAELYCRIGRELIAASPFKKTFVITHTENAVHVGYVPDRESADELVFQNFSTVKPGASEPPILEGVTDLFDRLKNTKDWTE